MEMYCNRNSNPDFVTIAIHFHVPGWKVWINATVRNIPWVWLRTRNISKSTESESLYRKKKRSGLVQNAANSYPSIAIIVLHATINGDKTVILSQFQSILHTFYLSLAP